MHNPQEHNSEFDIEAQNSDQGYTLPDLDRIRNLNPINNADYPPITSNNIRLRAGYPISALLRDEGDGTYAARYMGELMFSSSFCERALQAKEYNIFYFLALNPRMSSIACKSFEHLLMGFKTEFYNMGHGMAEDSNVKQRLKILSGQDADCPIITAANHNNTDFIALVIKLLATDWFYVSVMPDRFRFKISEEELNIRNKLTQAILLLIQNWVNIDTIKIALSYSRELFPGGFTSNLLDEVIPDAERIKGDMLYMFSSSNLATTRPVTIGPRIQPRPQHTKFQNL